MFPAVNSCSLYPVVRLRHPTVQVIFQFQFAAFQPLVIIFVIVYTVVAITIFFIFIFFAFVSVTVCFVFTFISDSSFALVLFIFLVFKQQPECFQFQWSANFQPVISKSGRQCCSRVTGNGGVATVHIGKHAFGTGCECRWPERRGSGAV